MDIRMSSLPGGGLLGGGGGGGCGHFMGKNTKHPIGPQVTLNMNVHPPVLDMAGLKPPSKSTSTLCGDTKKVGGQWLTSLRNMYNNLCSGPPVTWVNPDMVQQFQPAVMAQSLYPGTQYPVVGNQNTPLWFQATPGSQFDYQDPLQSVPYPYYDTGPPAYPKDFIPSPTSEFHKSTQPLNPEAKEWVPSSYKDAHVYSVPKCSFTSPDNNNVQNPLVIANMSIGFIEITDSEIEEVRKNMQNELPKKTQDHKITETSNNKQKPSYDAKIEVAGIGSDRLKESPHKVSENSSKESINCNTTSVIKLDDTLAKRQNDSRNDTSFDEHKDYLSLSYASIARKSPELPLQTKVEMGSEKESFSPDESVKQPLPKIFLKDKKYPKEKAPPLMENKRDPLPFRTASKTQKKSSRKFLRDLREVSPSKSDSSVTGSDDSFESVNSEVMSRLCIGNSPASVRLPGSTLPREGSVSACSIPPSMSPREMSASSCSIPPKNMKQRSMSESSGSSGSYVRTISESSTGSVESVDIEFGDECDIGNNNLENNCVLTEASSQSKSSSSVKHPESSSALVEICQPKSSKHPNNILAHILGLDSESEDSDDSDDDSDWDDADECDSLVLDDTWETFGLSLPLITKSLPCSESSNGDNLNNSENICDNDYCNISLEDINKQWEEEVTKDVMTASPSRVRFGDVDVHPMITWSYAYRNARRGPWEQHARDRVRFSNRISALEPILSPVLKARHCKIYGS